MEENVCFSFSSWSTPRKAFLDHTTILKLYPWAKTNIKCSNRKKLACERPPLCHTAASNITRSAIADQDSSDTYSMRDAHSTAVRVLGGEPCAVVTVHCSRCAVMRHWPALCICIILSECCQNMCASALLQLDYVHGSLYMYMNGLYL